ncbi:hypothetical protein [Mucilaginibacter agri]|uniref:DUF4251 domain-containing protein n=1 Tax=Mucilaginibacter agri TaxID=2695265 RepID=A0A966DUA1_9SPHI|nr:hypothetical protein [Mucilaginibacter agri]NCD72173.1 hypothetical protein [Mucilaginibacter agri]
MKKLLLSLILTCSAYIGFAQNQQLISYEDIRYLLHNNLSKADTFLAAKGYTLTESKAQKNRKYSLSLPQNTLNTIEMRSDGKKIFMSVQTNVLEQYNLLLNSISQYKTTTSNVGDVQVYQVKDLATIYITVNDSAQFDPLKKDYDIQIVPDKNVVAIN